MPDDRDGVEFTAELWEHDGPAAWRFVTLPPEAADAVRAGAAPPRPFGTRRVVVTVGASRWATSLFPDGEGRSYVLPVRASVQRAEGLSVGDRATVRLEFVPDH